MVQKTIGFDPTKCKSVQSVSHARTHTEGKVCFYSVLIIPRIHRRKVTFQGKIPQMESGTHAHARTHTHAHTHTHTERERERERERETERERQRERERSYFIIT